MLHVTLDREDRSINLQYMNDQLLLKLFNYERCIHLPVCTEIIIRVIVLDWVRGELDPDTSPDIFTG